MIPYQRDISGPSENVVTILQGDGRGGFHPMKGSPLCSAIVAEPTASLPAHLSGHGRHVIAVACAESKTLMLYERGADGRFTSSSIPIRGGWGSVAIAPLTRDQRGAIITANADAGSSRSTFLNAEH